MLHLRDFVLFCWCVFWLYWTIMAARTSKGMYAERSWYAVISRVAIIIVVFFLIRVPAFRGHSLVMHNTVLESIGTILFIAGLAIAVWARVNLGRNWGVPTAERKNTDLVTSGPYAYVHHPVYTGMLAAALGTAFALGFDWLILFAIMAFYFIWSAFQEEQYMGKRFPSYAHYRQWTRMLVSFLL